MATPVQQDAYWGLWRVDLADGQVHWSNELLALPAAQPPSMDRYMAALAHDARQEL